MKPRRPVLRYHGGKWRAAETILAHMPDHRCYVEPFGGSAAVLMQKKRVAAECYNDLDGRIVNIFRILQDPNKAELLRRRCYFTPFSRAEYERFYEPAEDEIDDAWKIIGLSFFGHGSDAATRSCRTGFRAKLSDGRALPASEWANWTEEVPAFIERLRGIVIEQRDAIEVIERFDKEDTLFYVDPPYLHETRSAYRGGPSHGYRFELSDEGHEALAKKLCELKGMVLLSGYCSPLYEKLYPKWDRIAFLCLADGARPRTEVLWLNPAAAARQRQMNFELVSNG